MTKVEITMTYKTEPSQMYIIEHFTGAKLGGVGVSQPP